MFSALVYDWGRQEFAYVAIGGAVVIALAVGLYAIPGSQLKVPGILLSIVGSLGAGLALGIIFMGVMGTEVKKAEGEGAGGDTGQAGPGGGRRGMMGGGRGGPNYKNQLANLVGKLDLLTAEKPPTVKLNDDQRQQVKDQLASLTDAEELSDDAAKEKLEKLQETLKDQKSTLEAVGYRWQGEGAGGGMGGMFGGGGPPGGGPPGGSGRAGPPPNPFKEGTNADHLKHLTERLGKGKDDKTSTPDK